MLRNLCGLALGLALVAACSGHPEEAAPASGDKAATAVVETPRPVTDKTLDDVLALHLAYLGGAEKVAAIKSVRLIGSIAEKGGPTFEVTVEKKRPMHFRRRLAEPNGARVTGFDGTKGWMQEGEGATLQTHEMPEQISLGMRRHFSIDDPLVDPAGKGFEGKLAGLVTLDGTDAYLVELKMADGQTASFYVDAKTGRLARSVEMLPSGQGPVRAEVTYSDEREAGGVQWAYHQEIVTPANQGGQTVAWRQIEVNPELDDALFASPGAAK